MSAPLPPPPPPIPVVMSYAAMLSRNPEQEALEKAALLKKQALEQDAILAAQKLEQDILLAAQKIENDEEYMNILDELHTRFILNLPSNELNTSERIFFQLEQAWWYYEDMICDKLEELQPGSCTLPRYANLKPFSKVLFEFSTLLSEYDFNKLWKEFSIYKRKISTYGCILLNKECTHVVLCQLYKSDTWTFPAGKINQNEIGIDAAARETYEETGFDPHCLYGLTKEWIDDIELSEERITWKYPLQDPEDILVYVEQPSGKRRTYYVCYNVPMNFPFEPVCRKEVDNIEWIDIRDIKEYKSFAVLPFIGKLKKWIKQRKSRVKNQSRAKSRPKGSGSGGGGGGRDKSTTKQRDKSSNGRSVSRDKSTGSRDKSSGGRDKSSGRRIKQDKRSSLLDAGLMDNAGDATRWTEKEMFDTNSKLMGGRIVEYDGNPHEFVEKGFGDGDKRLDPHSFHIVGGSFMNSTGPGDGRTGTGGAAAAGDIAANYQPLVRGSDVDNDGALQPFFSQHGASPWGHVVEEAKSTDDGNSRDGDSRYLDDDDEDESATNAAAAVSTSNSNSNTASQDLWKMLRSGNSVSSATGPTEAEAPLPATAFKKKKNKKNKNNNKNKNNDTTTPTTTPTIVINKAPVIIDNYNYDSVGDEDEAMIFATDKEITAKKQKEYESTHNPHRTLITQYENDMMFLKQWVSKLSNPIGFKIPNSDEIIDKYCEVRTLN